MQLRTACSLVITGLVIVPRSVLVTSFSPTSSTRFHANANAKANASINTNTHLGVSSTTDLDTSTNISAIDMPNVVAVDVTTTATSKSSASKKNRKSRRNPNKDINFLVKRTNQLISHQPTSSTTNRNKTHSTVTIQTFHWLMDAWIASLHPTAPEHSLSLMNCMKEYNIQPTSKTLTKVLNAYGKCGRGGEAAHEIMVSFLDGKNLDGKEMSFVYTALLEAYAEKPVLGSEGSVRNAVKTEQLLDEMMTKKGMTPNGRSFQAVIRAWGNSNVEIGALKGEQILDRMEKMVQSGEMEESEGASVIHYNAVLDAWANSVMDGHAWNAESLLNKMISEGKVQPNIISFNTCIDAYAKNGDGEEAEALMNKMEELYQSKENVECRPNQRSYNAVMNAFAKSLEKNAAAKAEKVLRKMAKMYEGSDGKDLGIKPDFISFATVINAWARSFEYGKAKKALQLYQEMVELYKKGDRSLRPNGKYLFHSIPFNRCTSRMILATSASKRRWRVRNLFILDQWG